MSFELGENVKIEPGAIINVENGFIGDRSIIRSGARVEGHYVEIGTESYLDHGAVIGGGSCFDDCAYLKAGDWLHMGWNSQINTARGVDIGHEVGIGIETKIFTHGAYLPVDFGFPAQWDGVKIGNRVWLPNAWVNPGVVISDNVVVAAKSLININLPMGCLVGGIPAKILKEHAFPKVTPWIKIRDTFKDMDTKHWFFVQDSKGHTIIDTGETEFNISLRTIRGPVTDQTELIKNQLRRNGIRFKYYNLNGEYVPWKS